MANRHIPLKIRFWRNVEKIPFHACWEWIGMKDKCGYGRISNNRKLCSAHRISWQIHNGDIQGELNVCHKCDNPGCVNPKHLFLGTRKDNTQDMIKKGRAKRCKGSKNGSSKLKEDEIKEIRSLYDSNMKQCDIAKIFKINYRTISLIVNKKAWKHV